MLLLSFALNACHSSEEPQTPIYPVYLQVSLQQSVYRTLLSPATIVVVETPVSASDRLGFGGLAIVHGWGLNEYYSYELACPYENKSDLHLQVQGSELICPQCKTKYEVLSGSGVPIEGVGKSPLRCYRVRYDQQIKMLTITN